MGLGQRLGSILEGVVGTVVVYSALACSKSKEMGGGMAICAYSKRKASSRSSRSRTFI